MGENLIYFRPGKNEQNQSKNQVHSSCKKLHLDFVRIALGSISARRARCAKTPRGART
jgi:hypothetical protein